jgi:tetratricopeptide (TPR) repeat protein
MKRSRGLSLCFGATVCLAIGLEITAAKRYVPPFPSLQVALASPLADLHDFGGIVLGVRRLAADVAWIQTLQYYGTAEEGASEFENENGIGKYPKFLAYCQRVARIDPHFTYVYYYGGTALGWNLGRLDEAEQLLREGIQNNHQEWRLPQYLAALAYQKNHDPAQLILFLEGYVSQPDCPNLLRALLANLYKKEKRYKDAIRIWLLIAETGDPNYSHRAQQQITTLAALDTQNRSPHP